MQIWSCQILLKAVCPQLLVITDAFNTLAQYSPISARLMFAKVYCSCEHYLWTQNITEKCAHMSACLCLCLWMFLATVCLLHTFLRETKKKEIGTLSAGVQRFIWYVIQLSPTYSPSSHSFTLNPQESLIPCGVIHVFFHGAADFFLFIPSTIESAGMSFIAGTISYTVVKKKKTLLKGQGFRWHVTNVIEDVFASGTEGVEEENSFVFQWKDFYLWVKYNSFARCGLLWTEWNLHVRLSLIFVLPFAAHTVTQLVCTCARDTNLNPLKHSVETLNISDV